MRDTLDLCRVFDCRLDCTARNCWEAVVSATRPPHREAGEPSCCDCVVAGNDTQFLYFTTLRWCGSLETPRRLLYARTHCALVAETESYPCTLRAEAKHHNVYFRLA